MSIVEHLTRAVGRRTESERATMLALGGLAWATYMACLVLGHVLNRGPVHSPENHFVLLANAFLHGHVGLTREQAASLMEIVPYDSHYYVAYPPMPAIVLLPLVAVLGTKVHTSMVSVSVAAITVPAAYLMLRRLEFSRAVSFWSTLLFAWGTTFWYTCLNGSPWYFAHIVSCFFFFVALCELYGENRAWLVGALFGAAVLSRLPIAMAAPVVLVLALLRSTSARGQLSTALQFGLGLAPFGALYLLYNQVRYGTVGNKGYVLIPGVTEEPWYAHGIVHPSYLPRNLYALVFQPPVLVTHFPYFIPSTFGLGLFFATPAFLLMFLAPVKRSLTWFAVAGSLLAMAAGLFHGWPGGTQFGYRFSLDAAPFLLILVALGLGQRVSLRAKLLIALSVLSCIWGLLYASDLPVQWIFDIASPHA